MPGTNVMSCISVQSSAVFVRWSTQYEVHLYKCKLCLRQCIKKNAHLCFILTTSILQHWFLYSWVKVLQILCTGQWCKWCDLWMVSPHFWFKYIFFFWQCTTNACNQAAVYNFQLDVWVLPRENRSVFVYIMI